VSRVLSALLVLVALFVAGVWSSDARLPGGIAASPVIVTKEVEHNILLMPLTGQEYKRISEPGATWMVPFSTVITLDRRLQHLNAEPVKVVISGGENLLTDYYVAWRIIDPGAFIRNFPQAQVDIVAGMKKARDRIQESVKGIVGETIARLEIAQLLERNEELDRLTLRANSELGETGVEVVDVQINRTELPSKSLEAAYGQMREQQHSIARENRVMGERLAREARAVAEKEARTTLAEARAFAERARGEGDAGAARTYADAYNRNPEFYAFTRSLEAYRNTLGAGTTMVLPPDHEFFRYLDPTMIK
jgi:membrane protease subunit HflC